MAATHTLTSPMCDLQTPKRNHYFHGKLLDAYHFELETEYLNFKRRMLNRLVNGYGVVCGLNVKQDPQCDDAIVVCPGFAIDRAGREIFVPEKSGPHKIPRDKVPSAGGQEAGERRPYVHVVLCYHECLAEPVPVHAGDCCKEEPCQPAVIREQFKIDFGEGCAKAAGGELLIKDVISNSDCEHDLKELHKNLVEMVSHPCPTCEDDPCIPLADIEVETDPNERCRVSKIDITVRPIVYNNDLLFQLLLSMLYEQRRYRAK